MLKSGHATPYFSIIFLNNIEKLKKNTYMYFYGHSEKINFN